MPTTRWPRPTHISDPIADDLWAYETPDGKRHVARLTVGRPAYWPRSRAWYCPLMIEGETHPPIKPIFGQGPVDALMNAMTVVKRYFKKWLPAPGMSPKSAKRWVARGNAAARRKKARPTTKKAPAKRSRKRPAKRR